jgi:hypothetical protein
MRDDEVDDDDDDSVSRLLSKVLLNKIVRTAAGDEEQLLDERNAMTDVGAAARDESTTAIRPNKRFLLQRKLVMVKSLLRSQFMCDLMMRSPFLHFQNTPRRYRVKRHILIGLNLKLLTPIDWEYDCSNEI